MKSFTALAGIIVMSIVFNAEMVDLHERKTTDAYLQTEQLIQKYGYPSEAHTVKTIDGYFLTMHRIPHGKQDDGVQPATSKGRKPPVFLQHGLLGTSSDFFIIAPIVSLAFMLADLGYDVWLGNVRGNTFSRAHETLFPSENKFWNFTWHESSVYDLPAQIDFICNHTKQEKLVYVGYSMGTTMFFVLMSALPQYNEKFELSLLMAPVVYLKNIKSIFLRFLVIFVKQVNIVVDLVDQGEFLENSKLLRLIGKIFCERNNIEKRLCLSAIFLLVGSDFEEFDKSRVAVLLNHYPAGYSFKSLVHYSQLVQSGKFQQYDYGKKGNLLQYGSPTPPEYNLNLTKTPLYFYQGKNDYLSTLKDVDHVVGQLPTLKKRYIVDTPIFTHLDFLTSVNVKTQVYDVLIDDLTSHLNRRDAFLQKHGSRGTRNMHTGTRDLKPFVCIRSIWMSFNMLYYQKQKHFFKWMTGNYTNAFYLEATIDNLNHGLSVLERLASFGQQFTNAEDLELNWIQTFNYFYSEFSCGNN